MSAPGCGAADDPRIVDTVKLVDALLKVDTPSGPSYHRYNGDGYGENADGSAFDGSGIGRLWPLLTGERGHYAVSAGGRRRKPYLEAMVADDRSRRPDPRADLGHRPDPALGLVPGKPSGSAMPLVWAHAEFLKLLAAETNGRPAELLDAVETRYHGKPPNARGLALAARQPGVDLPPAAAEDGASFVLLHFGVNNWHHLEDRNSVPTAFGMHGVRLDAEELDGARHRILPSISPSATSGWERIASWRWRARRAATPPGRFTQRNGKNRQGPGFAGVTVRLRMALADGGQSCSNVRAMGRPHDIARS